MAGPVEDATQYLQASVLDLVLPPCTISGQCADLRAAAEVNHIQRDTEATQACLQLVYSQCWGPPPSWTGNVRAHLWWCLLALQPVLLVGSCQRAESLTDLIMRLTHSRQLWHEVIGLGHSCLLLAVQLVKGSQGIGLGVLTCKPGSMPSATVGLQGRCRCTARLGLGAGMHHVEGPSAANSQHSGEKQALAGITQNAHKQADLCATARWCCWERTLKGAEFQDQLQSSTSRAYQKQP